MTEKDKTYKCLNPVGNQEPVDLYALAPRLDKLDGKTVHLVHLRRSRYLGPAGEETEVGLPQRQLDG